MPEEHCARCGAPIVGRRPHARYCTDDCCRAADLAARKKYRADRLLTLRCAECGEEFYAKYRGKQYCGDACRRKAKRRRKAQREGTPPDHVEKRCAVCDAPFTTRRFHQIYCSRQCAWHVLNGRRADKQRKGEASTWRTTSPALIARRAAAIRAGWDEATALQRVRGNRKRAEYSN